MSDKISYKCEKYVITTKQNKILTLGGFKSSKDVKDSQIRLFATHSHARTFIEESKYCNCEGLVIKTVIVKIQELGYE